MKRTIQRLEEWRDAKDIGWNDCAFLGNCSLKYSIKVMNIQYGLQQGTYRVYNKTTGKAEATITLKK